MAGGDTELAAEFSRDHAEPVTAMAAQLAVRWPYDGFGRPGRVVERSEIGDLGATEVHFANGVGLIVKPTAFRKDQILVTVKLGGGRLGLPRDRQGEVWAAGAFIGGGLQAISFEDSQRALAGHIYAASFEVGDRDFELKGSTRPPDFTTQLDVLAAYVAAPGYRAEAFERLRSAYLTALPQLAATPDGVISRDLDGLLHDGDARWSFPSEAELKAARPGDLPALLAPALAHGPIEVTVVGDISVDQAIAGVAATFGALPERPPVWTTRAPADPVHFPAATATPVTRVDTGRPDQAVAVVAWPTTDFYRDMKQSRAAMMAGEVLGNRILDQVRVAEGATYSPQTEVQFSETLPDYGIALSTVEMPPAKIPGYFANVTRIAAALRDSGLTEDELARARNPRVAGIERARLTNEYWQERLSGALADPRRLALIRTTLPDYQSLTTADLQAAAKRWFVDDRAWRLTVSAGKQADAAPSEVRPPATAAR